MKKLTTEEFITKANIIHSNKYEYGECIYVNTSTYLTITCKLHGNFSQRADHHLQKSGCQQCKSEKLYESRISNKEEFISKAIVIHKNVYDYTDFEYITARTKSTIICKKHGNFLQTPDSHLGGSGCPKCKMSKGESAVHTWLDVNNITFIPQKTFSDCVGKNNNKLRFDFYLPDYNLLIEFDGIQHFKPSLPRNNLEKAIIIFEDTKRRDIIKNNYCLDNNINLLRISYKDNIIKTLTNYFH